MRKTPNQAASTCNLSLHQNDLDIGHSCTFHFISKFISELPNLAKLKKCVRVLNNLTDTFSRSHDCITFNLNLKITETLYASTTTNICPDIIPFYKVDLHSATHS